MRLFPWSLPSLGPTRQKTLAIATPGGDAAGQNAFIYYAMKAAHEKGWRVLGVRDGFLGLTRKDKDGRSDPDVIELTPENFPIANIKLPSTALNSCREVPKEDPSAEIISVARRLGITAWAVPVGDGSLEIAHNLSQKGLLINTAASTIDNDIAVSETALGFDTATRELCRSIRDTQATSASFGRVIFVESMGRHAGKLAVAGTLRAIEEGIQVAAALVSEITSHYPSFLARLKELYREGEIKYNQERRINPLAKRPHITVVVAEGAKAPTGEACAQQNGNKHVIYGGIADIYAKRVREDMNVDTTAQARSYGTRGAPPTKIDIKLGKDFAENLVAAIIAGESGKLFVVQKGKITSVPMADAVGKSGHLTPDHPSVRKARGQGVYFGERTSTARGQVFDSLHA
jgi:6-phosphofructokinase